MYSTFSYYKYLVNKYGVNKPTTMLKVEAKAMGIPYPLPNGWLDTYATWLHRELEQPDIERFLGILIKAKQKIGTPKEPYHFSQIRSLQAGIDFIFGKPFDPINAAIKKPPISKPEPTLDSCLDKLHRIGHEDIESQCVMVKSPVESLCGSPKKAMILLLAMVSKMDKRNRVVLPWPVRNSICKETGMNKQQMYDSIGQLIKSGLLKPLDENVYMVNPEFFGSAQ